MKVYEQRIRQPICALKRIFAVWMRIKVKQRRRRDPTVTITEQARGSGGQNQKEMVIGAGKQCRCKHLEEAGGRGDVLHLRAKEGDSAPLGSGENMLGGEEGTVYMNHHRKVELEVHGSIQNKKFKILDHSLGEISNVWKRLKHHPHNGGSYQGRQKMKLTWRKVQKFQ